MLTEASASTEADADVVAAFMRANGPIADLSQPVWLMREAVRRVRLG